MKTLTHTTKTSLPLRPWQSECLMTLFGGVDKGETQFTVVATMGSGKTFLQGAFAKQLLDAGLIDWVVNVVPSDTLRENNSSNLKDHFSIHLNGAPSYKHNGHIITFQGLSRRDTAERLLRQLQGKSFLLLIDEVHHGSAEGTPWGDAILGLMNQAAFTLSLSGTMWRSDSTKIAGIRYKQIEDRAWEVHPHYVYSLGHATNDNTVSDVVFHELGANVTYRINGEDGDELIEVATDNIKDSSDVAKAYKHVINPEGGFVTDLLTEAHDELITKQRAHYANYPMDIPPGGLVVCADIQAAEQVAKLLYEQTGKMAVVVHSGTPNAKDLISRFAKHELPADWLVSVRMVSEGVDVPRIKVIAYLSSVRTKLSFHQIVGRAMRIRRSLTGEVMDETASVFLPAFAGLHVHVREFVNESRITVVKPEPRNQQELIDEPEVYETPNRREELISSSGTFWETFIDGVMMAINNGLVQLRQTVV